MNNIVKEKFRKGEKPIGMFLGTGSAIVAECLGRTGIDYIIVDNEHSPAEAETSAALFRAAERMGIGAFARVREISRPAILKLLDVGAQGLIIPNVSTVDQVREIIDYGKYYPIGNRGFCPSRKDGWGADIPGSPEEVMKKINEDTMIIPQCETVGALKNIETIVSMEGVDGIFVGPYDLSISMGIPGKFELPEFQKALDDILRVCKMAKKPCILYAGTMQSVLDGFERGFDSMTYSIDACMIIECVTERIAKIRNRI